MILLFSLLMVCVTLAECTVNVKPCSQGLKPCQWYDWGSWQTCSLPCAGGVQRRRRAICCTDALKTNNIACLQNCSYIVSDTFNTQGCNEFCHNGGRYDGYYCQCPPGTSGDCCEKVAPTTKKSTTTPSTTTTSTTTPSTTTSTTTTPSTTTTRTTTPSTTTTSTTTPSTTTASTTTSTTTKSTAAPSTTGAVKTLVTSKPSTNIPHGTAVPPSPGNSNAGVTGNTPNTLLSAGMGSGMANNNMAIASMKEKLSCNSNKYTDCHCVFGKEVKKERSITRDIEFSGFGAILGFIFSILTYLFWTCCEQRRPSQNNVNPMLRKLPSPVNKLSNLQF